MPWYGHLITSETISICETAAGRHLGPFHGSGRGPFPENGPPTDTVSNQNKPREVEGLKGRPRISISFPISRILSSESQAPENPDSPLPLHLDLAPRFSPHSVSGSEKCL